MDHKQMYLGEHTMPLLPCTCPRPSCHKMRVLNSPPQGTPPRTAGPPVALLLHAA
jgi:hypothetical protein